MAGLRFFWKLLGIGTIITFAYYGAMFVGAYLTLVEMPRPPLFWNILAFWGAAMLAAENTFPSLRDRTQ